MSTIKVQCTDQVLRITESPVIASGGVNEDYVQFTFCPLWDGYTKTAVFYMDEKFVYHSSVDDEDKCVIPKEAMNEKGKMYFGVFGVNGDIVRTSEVLPYIIKKGAITQESTPDPTPDIYAQILASVAAAKIKSATINSNGNLIIATQDNQTYDAGKAKGADGKTPVKGTDYWTDADKSEIVEDTKNAIDLSSYQQKSTLETDVAAKGFTKNTGTYTKPSTGIPKSDLASDVQTSLSRADTLTDTYINSLIDTAVGVIENGSY